MRLSNVSSVTVLNNFREYRIYLFLRHIWEDNDKFVDAYVWCEIRDNLWISIRQSVLNTVRNPLKEIINEIE